MSADGDDDYDNGTRPYIAALQLQCIVGQTHSWEYFFVFGLSVAFIFISFESLVGEAMSLCLSLSVYDA